MRRDSAEAKPVGPGEVIRFPQERCRMDCEDYRPEPAIILIFPVIRIER